MTAPGKMKRFKLTKIAFVDSPAQKGALAMFMKRDKTTKNDPFNDSAYERICKRTFSADERKKAESSGAAMPGGRYPIENVSDLHNAIRAVGRGKGSHAAIRSHIMSRARALGATSAIPDDWKASKADASRVRIALRGAGFSDEGVVNAFADRIVKDALGETDPDDASLFEDGEILKADQVDEADDCYRTLLKSVESIFLDEDVNKAALLQETLEQFKDAFQSTVSDEVEPAIGKALAASEGSTDTMSLKVIAKFLGLKEDATEAEINKAIEERDTLDKLVAKMSAKHTAYMNHEDATMPKGGKKAFAEMEPGERDKHMAAHPVEDEDEEDDGEVEKSIKKGDAFRDEDGTVFTKRDFGSEKAFNLAKRQNDKIKKQAGDFAKSEEARLVMEFSKRAEPLEYIGKADEVGSVLLAVAKFDTKLADKVEALLKTANTKLESSALFTEQGSGAQILSAFSDINKAAGQIEAGARDLLSKEPKLFENARLDKMAAARTEFRKRNPELAKREEEERGAVKAENRRKAA